MLPSLPQLPECWEALRALASFRFPVTLCLALHLLVAGILLAALSGSLDVSGVHVH